MDDATSTHLWGNADAYEAYIGRWSRPVAETALAWLGLPPGLTWLDVGCGTGALTEAILEAADPREVLGVDPSADLLATAAGQIADPRVRFAVGDARALPVPDDAYDAVVAGLVLHFVPDPRPEFRRLLAAAPPGRVVPRPALRGVPGS
jgi:ubiquinone/menaquinone biosynthesis C-methylase UbiE